MTGERRPAAVAGSFYPDDRDALRALVTHCLAGVPAEGRRCVGAIVPHAALVYSGKCAAAVLGRIALPRVVVIVAPNHTGVCRSPGASLWRRGAFETPLGDVPVEASFAEALERECDLAGDDPAAHRGEHAIEVELPFLRVLAPEAAIVPIVLAWDDWARCRQLGEALARVVRSVAGDVLLVASSDMSHYERASIARRKDDLALAAVRQLDGQALLDTCRRESVTMCGRAPASVVVTAAHSLGATHAEVVDYTHSGLVTGDHESVVSYAGVLIS